MKKIFAFCLMFILLFILNTTIVKADCKCDNGTILKSGNVSVQDCENLKKSCSSGSDTTVSLTNPLTGTQTSEGIPVLLGKVISSILGVIGSLALVMFIYGGVIWMLSAGNQEQVTKGKNILIWATVGIVIIFTSYALVKFVLTTVTTTG